MKDCDCKYCHGDQKVAEIAKMMGFRPDVAFVRIKNLEDAMREFISYVYSRYRPDDIPEAIKYHVDRFKQLLAES